jgi:hypothetical protein
MFHKNPKLVNWFLNNLPYDPIHVLFNGYHAPIRYDLFKNFLNFDHDDEQLLRTEQEVKHAQRRLNLLLTLERILNNIDKFDESRKEEMLIKLASIVKELRFYNCSRKMTSITKALTLLIKYQNKDGSFPVSLAGNAFIIETIVEYGVVTNPFVENALKWLLKQQNDDKGWGSTTAGYSDVWLTTKVLHIFSYSMKYMKNTKIKKGMEFVLTHLYVENPGGIIEGKQAWENFSGDYMLEGSFVGGVLSVLEVCARLNISAEDPRVAEMLEWLKSKQLKSGHWPSQTYDIYDKRSDERVTMRVVRILRLFYIMPQQGSATIKTFKIKQDGRTSAKKPGFIIDPEAYPKPEIEEESDEL